MVESTAEFDRRMTAVERRLDYIDENGSRAVNRLIFQVGELAKDVGSLESSVKSAAGGRWATIITLAVALMPLYIMTITILTTKGK
jgi:hypothetical protein